MWEQTEIERRCTTHHLACECREELFAKGQAAYRRARDWSLQSGAGLRLRCGELTASEIRTVRAVLRSVLGNTEDRSKDDTPGR